MRKAAAASGKISALMLCLAMTSSCERIPGTKLHQLHLGKKAASEALYDPSSAQFRNVSINKVIGRDDEEQKLMEWAVCGEINGKNLNGAYAGFKKFVANPKDGDVLIDSSIRITAKELEEAVETCSKSAEQAKTNQYLVDIAKFNCLEASDALNRYNQSVEFDTIYTNLCKAELE